jgi:hypothetical protein
VLRPISGGKLESAIWSVTQLRASSGNNGEPKLAADGPLDQLTYERKLALTVQQGRPGQRHAQTLPKYSSVAPRIRAGEVQGGLPMPPNRQRPRLPAVLSLHT